LFLAADAVQPQRLFEAGRTTGPPVPFATNRMAIVVPAANPAGIRSLADLARPGVKIVTAADHDPVSRYAAQAIDRFSRLPEAPPGFVAAYVANVRSTEKDARAVLTRLEFGEADAAIGYATDASVSTFVTVIEIPERANVRATYAGVVIKGSLNGSYGERFLLRLVDPDGQAILTRHGFLPPE
jgi:molybdate transport system substrate-binding protein